MARYAARKANRLKTPLHAGRVLRDVWIALAVGAFEPGIGDHSRPAMPRPGDVDHVEVARSDHTVQVHVDEVEAGGSAPMTEQARLDVLQLKRLLQERVVEEINLGYRQVGGRTATRVD